MSAADRGDSVGDDQESYAEQYERDQQAYWEEAYADGNDDDPPRRGGWYDPKKNKDAGDKPREKGKKEAANQPKPKPIPPPVNNPK